MMKRHGQKDPFGGLSGAGFGAVFEVQESKNRGPKRRSKKKTEKEGFATNPAEGRRNGGGL